MPTSNKAILGFAALMEMFLVLVTVVSGRLEPWIGGNIGMFLVFIPIFMVNQIDHSVRKAEEENRKRRNRL